MPRAEAHDADRSTVEPSAGEERRLVAAALAGETHAAERLAAASYGRVFASLVKLTGGDRDLAADLTQDTYRKAWRSLASFDRRARFGTWLYRIAYTTYLNHVRRPRPVEPLEAVPEA